MFIYCNPTDCHPPHRASFQPSPGLPLSLPALFFHRLRGKYKGGSARIVSDLRFFASSLLVLRPPLPVLRIPSRPQHNCRLSAVGLSVCQSVALVPVPMRPPPEGLPSREFLHSPRRQLASCSRMSIPRKRTPNPRLSAVFFSISAFQCFAYCIASILISYGTVDWISR